MILFRRLFFTAIAALFLTAALRMTEASAEEGSLDTIDVFLVIKGIERINERIANDIVHNGDSSKNSAVETIIKRKIEALRNASKNILFGYVENHEKINAFLEERGELEVKIDTNRKLGYDLAVMRDRARVAFLDLNIRANSFFLSLNKEAHDKFDKSRIDLLLEGEIARVERIETKEYEAALKAYPSGDIRGALAENFERLESRKEAYLELLRFSRDSYLSYIGTETIILGELNVKKFRDIINDFVGVKVGVVGVGEVLLSLLIILFFLSIRKALASLIVLLGNKTLYEVKNEQTRKYLTSLIKRPLAFLLFVISLELSLDAILYPEPAADSVKQWFYTIEVFGVGWALIGLVSGYGKLFAGKLATKNEILRKEVANLLIKVVYFLIFVIGLLLVLHRFGLNVSAIVASLGIGGLAVALAAKDTLANFFASIMILLDNSISQGDWIVCGDDEGTVVEIGLRTTTIRTFDNALIFIPNSKLSSETIRNWNRRKVGRRIKMHIGVEYSSTKEKIAKCVDEIKEMLIHHPQIASPSSVTIEGEDIMLSYNDAKGYKSTLLVYLDQFNTSSIDILIYCFSKTVAWDEWLAVKQDVMFQIMEIVEKNGLSFAFPTQSIHLESMPK